MYLLSQFLDLSGERVSGITKVYDDNEALTRLLEEKEKDLELTVQIGKELLAQNNNFEKKTCGLELEMKNANDLIQQLKQDLENKNNIISILTNDNDSILKDINDTDNDVDGIYGNNKNADDISLTIEKIEHKIGQLQGESSELKKSTAQLMKETDKTEAKEKQLFDDLMLFLKANHTEVNDLSKFN